MNVVFFLIGIIATVLNFEFLKKIPVKMKKCGELETAIFGILNGLIVVFTISEIENIAPLWIILICPLIMTSEIIFLSDDTWRCYFCMYMKCLFNFGCIYWSVTNILGMFGGDYVEQKTVFFISVVTVSLFSFYLSKSKKFPITKFKMMLHEKAAGKMLFKYIVICNVFLVFTTWNHKVFYISEATDAQMLKMLCTEMFLKTAFIWWSSRLLFEMIANQLSYVKNEVYTETMLDKERAFRNTIMKKGIFSFNVNLTDDEIREGKENFNASMWTDVNSYSCVISQMKEWGIHPEDQEEFIRSNSYSIIVDRVDTIPYYSHQVRINPTEMLRHFMLPDKLVERYKNIKKEWVWIKFDYVYTRNVSDGSMSVYVAAFDVDLQVEQGEKLRKSATIDFLTGVLNRAAIEKKINDMLMEKTNAGAFILVDIDNFKSVNDMLGHPVGDEVLKEVAKILKESFRKGDYIGRLGGDEFCIFMQNVTEVKTIEEKIKTLNERCHLEYCGENGEIVNISASIGVAVCTKQISEYNQLYKCADMALYETKKRGKDSYTIFSEEKINVVAVQ